MPGIEFVGAEADDEPADDLLDTGPRRPWPRWVWVVAGLLAVAGAVGVVASARSDHTPKAAPSTDGSTSAPADPGPVQQVTSLTSDGTSLFWLAGARLYRAGPVGRAAVSAAVDAVADDFVETPLVADPAERTVWRVYRGSVDYNGDPGSVEGFATETLDRTTVLSAPALINGAVAFDGALYVLAGGRLLRATAGAPRFETVARVDAHARDLVTVPGGLMYIEGGNASALGRWTPGGGVRPAEVLTTTDSSLASVGSTVYVAGTRDGRTVLDARYPTSPPQQQEITTGLSQVRFVATGRASLILLGTDEQGIELACVTGVTNRGVVHAIVRALATATSANVAVLHGTVFQAAGDEVRPVTFPAGGCPG